MFRQCCICMKPPVPEGTPENQITHGMHISCLRKQAEELGLEPEEVQEEINALTETPMEE